ncbi:MAG: FliM/FliN family flagellar motor switch protein [Halieaceae bacterium]|jgi:flagellar motor switch protein FliM|nr:FliM/FliN family flagellar motor switch protein [Halieaceae bacterium]
MAEEEVLTESEIDALMETVEEGKESSEPSDDGEYRRFDFNARDRSILREFTALTALIERHAEDLAERLEKAFSIEFEVRAQAPALLPVQDVIASLESAAAVTTVTLKPLQEPVFLIAPSSLLSFIVNAYFGGSTTRTTEAREHLTPTELRIAERLVEIQLGCLTDAWRDKLPLDASEPVTLGVADRLQMLPGTDVLLKLAFSMTLGEFEGKAYIFVPFAELEKYQPRFAPPRREAAHEKSDSWEAYFRRELADIEIEVAAVFSGRSITLAELLEVKTGSVVPIAPPEQVRLCVEGTTIASGRYGALDGMKAVQVHRLGRIERA